MTELQKIKNIIKSSKQVQTFLRDEYTLTPKQKKFLKELLRVQEEKIFNNGRKQRIIRILKDGTYDENDKTIMNNIGKVFKEYKKTGIVPEHYRY